MLLYSTKEFPILRGYCIRWSDTRIISSAPVGNYNLYVNFRGTLSGHYLPNYKDVIVEISSCMWDMANFFYTNRVAKEPKKYLKFKIVSNDSIGK